MAVRAMKHALIACTVLATTAATTVAISTPASANVLLGGGCGASISTFDATNTVCATDYSAVGYYLATYYITWEPAAYWDTTYLVGCTMILRDSGGLGPTTQDCLAEAKAHRSSSFPYPFGPHQGVFYAQGQYHLVWHNPVGVPCQYDAKPATPGSTWCGYWSMNTQSPPAYVI